MEKLSPKLIDFTRRLVQQCAKEGIDPHKVLSIYQSHPEYSTIHIDADGETINMMNDMDAVEKFLAKIPHLLDDGK